MGENPILPRSNVSVGSTPAAPILRANQRPITAKGYQQIDLTNPRFGGPNVLEADVELDGRTRTVHCAVSVTGTNSTDPAVVTSVEVLP